MMPSSQPPAGVPAAIPDPHADLAGQLGDLADAHVAVIGSGSLDAMCSLIRAGCGAVAEIASGDRAPIEPVEIALIPAASTPHAAAQAVSVAYRALLPGGRVVLRDPTGTQARGFAALLRAHGFSAVRIRFTPAGCLVSGERAIYGQIIARASA